MPSPENTPSFQSPCRHLRNKEMHYQTSQEEDEFASGVHWCAKTQEAFGPDGQPAAKTDCCASRSCFAAV